MIKFDKFTLNNGLRVIVYQDKTTPLVAFNLLYNVGAKNEDPNKTGFAHLFEHLMFGGSLNIPNYDRVLQKAGGENNAFTNNDFTNYYISLPKQNIETAFYLESDRMLGLDFSEKSLEIQKNVVIEEFRQRFLNQPYGDVSFHLRSLAYKKHPYNWPTIGKETDHILNAKLDEVKDFFYNNYAPNNAILTIGGDIETNEVKALCEKWFADIPARDLKRRPILKEPKQKERRILNIDDNDVPSDAIYMAYKMCSRLDKEYYTTDLISDLLTNGKSSILNINLVKEKQLFPNIDAYILGSYDPGLFIINAKLYEKTDFETAESSIKEELKRIAEGDFTERQLTKVKNRVLSTLLFSRIGVLNIVMELAYCEWIGNADIINQIENNYMTVSKEDIIKTASKLFNDNNLSCIYYKSKRQ